MALNEEELKAQQQYYRRSNGPVIGKRSTLSTQPNKLFKESQQTKRIPENFKSWADAERAFLEAIDDGMKPDKARKKLGLTYQNVIGNYYFDVVTDRKTGERRGFNPRAVNEDIHPIAERDLRKTQGDAAVDNFRGQLKDGWGDYKKKAAYDPMAISAQDEARQVRNYLTSFFGRGDPRDQGMQVQRGHGFSASQSGGATIPMDLWPELGHYNVHGHAGLAGNPRYHPDVMYEMNAADTAEAAYYNEDLDRRGLTINPRATQWPGAMMAVDESGAQTFGRKSGQSYSMGPAIERTPGVTEAALPAQQRLRDELMAQMGTAGPKQAVNEANSRSMIMDTTQSSGTPLRIIQSGTPVTPAPKDVKATVVSPGGFERTIKVPQSTREQLTSKLIDAGVEPSKVESIVNKARPFSKGPTIVPAPTQAQNIGGYLPVPIPTGSQFKQLASGVKGQLPFTASSAIEPLQRGEPTKALEEVAKGTAIGMATDPIVKPIMSRLIPAVGAAIKAAPVAAPAAIAAATELAAPRAAQGGPERVTVNGTPYWLDKKSNKVYTNDGRPTSFGIDIKGGKPQLVPRGQGAGTKKAEDDPLRQATKGNLMPVLNMLNPMSQLLRFTNTAVKTIRKDV